jgi:group I intron endonuclease
VDLEKLKILQENTGKSGIYMLKNLINRKRYIGSSINLKNRLSYYYSNSSMEASLKRGKTHICSALLKYGRSNFSLEILEYCSIKELLKRERHFIDILDPEYNIVQDPTLPPMLGRKHSDETREIMSDSHKEIENSGRFTKEHIHSDETRKKISDTCKKIENSGRFKKGQKKLGGSGKPSQQIEVFDFQEKTTTYYNSISDATRALNLSSHKIIANYLLRNQKKLYKGRYAFKNIHG